MNILFWNDTLEVGGGETWAMGTALHLRKRGHGVAFACPGGSWTREQALLHEAPHFDYFFDPAFSAHFLWQAESFLRRNPADVILCTVMGNRTEAALLSGLVRRIGRGSVLLRVGSAPWPGLSTAHLGYGMEDVVRGTLVNSAFLKRQILARYPEIPEDRVQVLYNGVDTAAPEPSLLQERRVAIRDELGIGREELLVSAVGRLADVKNYPLLLRAMARVFRSRPESVLAIHGEGPEAGRLGELCRELGIEGRVRFAGFRKDIPEVLAASDLFVHASMMEGASNAILEAMAAGRAAVATAVGGIPELVTHGETGLLIPPGNEEEMARALVRMLGDRELRDRMGRAGRVRAQACFDRDLQVSMLERILERAAERDFGVAGNILSSRGGLTLPPQPPEMFFPGRCTGRIRRVAATPALARSA